MYWTRLKSFSASESFLWALNLDQCHCHSARDSQKANFLDESLGKEMANQPTLGLSRQWPEVSDFVAVFAHCASQKTHGHARIARVWHESYILGHCLGLSIEIVSLLISSKVSSTDLKLIQTPHSFSENYEQTKPLQLADQAAKFKFESKFKPHPVIWQSLPQVGSMF